MITLYGTCIECKQQRSHYRWCQSCERKQCEENFKNWTSGNERIDTFLRDAQLNSTRPQTFLEWIPFDKLGNINILNSKSGNRSRTVYSAIWKDGPRIWNQQNEKYERVKTKVIIKLNKDNDDINQINEILNELKIYLDCHNRENALLIQYYGISKDPANNDYFIVKQFHNNTPSLTEYIFHYFNNLNWEKKLHLLLYLSEDLKALHNAGYVYRYYIHPSGVSVFDDSFCAIETFLDCKALPLSNKNEKGGWYPYKAPEILVNQPYTKASDIYSFGMIMHAIGTGKIPPYDYPSHSNHFNRYLTFDICFGLRPHIPDIIPKSFKNLMERCWDTEPDLRPSINDVHYTLYYLWSSIYHNKNATSLNMICLEFLAAENNKDYSKSKYQEVTPQKAEGDNLEPLEMIKYIKKNKLIEVINMNELTNMTSIDNDDFCKISKATLNKEEKNILVACKRFKNTQLDKTFFHELKKHKKLYFCLRILNVLGISLDEDTKEYLLIIQYTDGGNLHQYLKNHFSEMTWNDKIKLAYQITEGIKFLHDEDVLHQNLHPKNIVIHKKEAKITLDIVKSTEIDYSNISDEIIPFVDPKLIENHSYGYDKKSNIYSLGVLMWELSSGESPFINNINENDLRIDLINGIREKKVPDTPDKYFDLYKSCWHSEPNERPSINQVFSKLGKILYAQTKTSLEPSKLIDFIKNNYLIKIINKEELSNINGSITWKKKDCTFPVICKKFKCIQLNETFIHELKMHRKLIFYSRIVHILGIGLDESVGECSLIMQYADGGNLRQYFEKHFSKLTMDDKIKLAYQITEGIKFLHDLDIIHQNLHSKNIVIHKNEAKIMLDLIKGTNADSSNDDEMMSYVDPKLLENNSYELNKKSDIYSLGVLMWELTSGHPPKTENILKSHIIDGYRETRIPNTPKEYFDLYESCWHPEPNIRPSINQIFNKLEEMNKNSGLELINLIKKYKLIKEINMNELYDMKNIDGGHFGIISRARWKKTNDYVICKRLKNNESISNKPTEALLHELNMHGRLNFCQRIIRILDEKSKEYMLILEYANGGNLRQYLKQKNSELTWDDKIKLAYQITEGIKYLQGEKILHRDLHSGNIVIHQGEAKIIDLGIAKSTETQTNIHSGVFGSLPYIDPKILEDHSYKYNEKSDIYSLGVLMWELSSGVPPFIYEIESVLKHQLVNGRREEPVPDTPDEYLQLYESCWDPEPNKRPSICQVFNKLIKLGKMRNVQDFQDIEYDDDNIQDIQDDNDNDNDNDNDADVQEATTKVNISNADDNDDLDIPD
ncbi:kinase-like domain-containing protein [Rhizophagus clarus]|uniref:Kinase-like domain-containing protein n=1 Tax=Rhizophagus clarus TaxID=94130 RepID=A0A8H3KY89_9GLOM|nr:kinase-like domain-containing protein [Rhizophagus clarus]